jgi:hypothetical protein
MRDSQFAFFFSFPFSMTDNSFGVASAVKCTELEGQVDVLVRYPQPEAPETGLGQFLELHCVLHGQNKRGISWIVLLGFNSLALEAAL